MFLQQCPLRRDLAPMGLIYATPGKQTNISVFTHVVLTVLLVCYKSVLMYVVAAFIGLLPTRLPSTSSRASLLWSDSGNFYHAFLASLEKLIVSSGEPEYDRPFPKAEARTKLQLLVLFNNQLFEIISWCKQTPKQHSRKACSQFQEKLSNAVWMVMFLQQCPLRRNPLLWDLHVLHPASKLTSQYLRTSYRLYGRMVYVCGDTVHCDFFKKLIRSSFERIPHKDSNVAGKRFRVWWARLAFTAALWASSLRAIPLLVRIGMHFRVALSLVPGASPSNCWCCCSCCYCNCTYICRIDCMNWMI